MKTALALALVAVPLACAPGADAPHAPPFRPSPPPASAPASAATAPDEPVPAVRLPSDVRPLEESIELRIVPADDGFSGAVEITVLLERARRVLWLHGRDLHVTRATVTPEGAAPMDATWESRHPSGVASLTLPRAIAAGKAKIRIEYDAAIGKSLKGLYRATQNGEAYVFTQFEAIAARQAFPCFDEPSAKIPFFLTLVVPSAHRAVANAKDVATTPEGAMTRVKFAPTLPIPSYLVAFAVGPLDVVPAPDVPPNAARKRPLALRGVAAKGRGPEMAYALAHTGEILGKLEEYFGVEYPYDKLDILAVPDREGAMENAGAVTFKEWLLLMDEKTAPLGQKRAFASVMAHELAHQWFGDLVTMKWWDDLWLNESFATWMGSKGAEMWNPKLETELGLLGGIQGAMGNDALVSARAIRQPIASTHDIENAFDSITYQKGGGVLSMFERWLGRDVFRDGVHRYLENNRFGATGADDFLGALSAAAGKDVKAPFHTFLDQAGVPMLDAEVRCDGAPRLHVKQSRYFPIGSNGDATRAWQIPVCARVGVGKTSSVVCDLVTEREADVALNVAQCPDWVMPNADAAGYYRFALPPGDLAKLRKASASLDVRERMSFANGVRAAYGRGSVSFADALDASAPLANEARSQLAGEPMHLVSSARDWLWDDAALRAKVEGYARGLYARAYARLGWSAAKGEDSDVTYLRQSVIGFLAFTARDPAVRAEARRRGLAYLGAGKDGAIHRDAVDPNMAGIAVAVAGEEADAKLFDAMAATLGKTADEDVRGKILWALGSTKDPALAARAREMALDPSLRVNEVMTTIWAQLQSPPTREETWKWILARYDVLVARISGHHGSARLIGTAGVFCDEAHAQELERFFGPRVDSIEGGPRVLASTLESIRLCAARRKVHEPGMRAFFAKR